MSGSRSPAWSLLAGVPEGTVVVWTGMEAVGVDSSGKVGDIFGSRNCRAWQWSGCGDEGKRPVKGSTDISGSMSEGNQEAVPREGKTGEEDAGITEEFKEMK